MYSAEDIFSYFSKQKKWWAALFNLGKYKYHIGRYSIFKKSDHDGGAKKADWDIPNTNMSSNG